MKTAGATAMSTEDDPRVVISLVDARKKRDGPPVLGGMDPGACVSQGEQEAIDAALNLLAEMLPGYAIGVAVERPSFLSQPSAGLNIPDGTLADGIRLFERTLTVLKARE